MHTFCQIGLVAAVTGVGAGVSWVLNPYEPPGSVVCDPTRIAADQICAADVPEGALWIDARSREEWQANGVEGSILWNFDAGEDAMEMEANAAMALMDAQMAVVYCGSEACGTSRQVAEKVNDLGLGKEVKVLFGGWEALKDSSLVR